MKRLVCPLILGVAVFSVSLLGQAPSGEQVARRQLNSGRALAGQGNYAEALKDFQTVVEAFPDSSVADDALLEMGRYYLDILVDRAKAAQTADQIIKKYPTSNSAPYAHVLTGRVAMSRSRNREDLDVALVNFDRVAKLFPSSPAVPLAAAYSGEALRLERQNGPALDRFESVIAEFPFDPAAAAAHLGVGSILASQGDAIQAMEEFQRVRDRFADREEAAAALTRGSLLFRLYVRAKSGSLFTFDPQASSPSRTENITSILATRGGVYFATENAVGKVSAAGDPPPSTTRPRTLTQDSEGRLYAVEPGLIRPQTGAPIPLAVTREGGGSKALEKIVAMVATSTGDWIVADEDERSLHRFSSAGRHLGAFAPARVTRLTINDFDDVAGIDRETKAIVFFDAGGKVVGRLASKGTGYEFDNPIDITYDALGHLYVLDRATVFVFGPAPSGGTAPAAAPAASSTAPVLRLMAAFTEPEKNPGAFRRATAFAIDASGTMYLADERAPRILLYR